MGYQRRVHGAGDCMLVLAWVWSNYTMHGLAHGHEVALLEQAWSQGFGANSRFLSHPRADAFRGECLGMRVEFSRLECKGRTDCGSCACYVRSLRHRFDCRKYYNVGSYIDTIELAEWQHRGSHSADDVNE